MSNDESFDEFFAKLNDIVNSAYNLSEIYNQPKIVRKILRSLTENFRPKVTAITESKDVDFIPVDELVGSFQSYKLDTTTKYIFSDKKFVTKSPISSLKV